MIVRFGLKDSIKISNQHFAEIMPAVPELTDVDIGYVLTYVTLRFGDAKEKYSLEEVKKSVSLGKIN